MSDSDSTSSLTSTSECSKPPSVIQNESSKDVSLSRSISSDSLLNAHDVNAKGDDCTDDGTDDLMKYLLNFPCSDSIGSPQSYSRTSMSHSPKVGLDHLNNLCKLMEQLGELREQNNRLQRRVQYLEDKKDTKKDIKKEIKKDAVLNQQYFIEDVSKPTIQHQSTSTDGLTRFSSDETFITNKSTNNPVKGKGGYSKFKKSLSIQRERSKSLGNGESPDEANELDSKGMNKTKDEPKGSKWEKLHSVSETQSPEIYKDGNKLTIGEEMDNNSYSTDDSSDEFLEGIWEDKIRAGLFREIPDDDECNFLTVPSGDYEDPSENYLTLAVKSDINKEKDHKLSSLEESEVGKKSNRTRWGKVKTMIQSRKGSIKKRAAKESEGDRGSAVSMELSVTSEYEDDGESDSNPKIKIEEYDWKKFREIHECILQGKEYYPQDGPNLLTDGNHSSPGSPPLSRRSKWTKVKKVFLNRSPENKSVPSSPKNPVSFTYDIEDTRYPKSHSDNLEDELLGGHCADHPPPLPPRYHSLDLQKNLEELQKNLTLDFNKKLQEWDKMKTRRSSTLISSPQEELSQIHVSHDFAKKLQEWEKLRGIKSDSMGLHSFYSSFGPHEIPKNLPHQFTKKLQEWERIKAGKQQTNPTHTSPKLERKPQTGHKLKKLKQKEVSKIKHRDKDMQWLEKELHKIEREKQRLEREREKYLEREARLEKMRDAIQQPKATQEVFIRTSTGEFRFEGISQTFTRKLFEWEERKGIGPEASTIALLNPNCHSLAVVANETTNSSMKGRSKSEGSIVDVLNNSVHSQPSSLSLDAEIDSNPASKTLLHKALMNSECRRGSGNKADPTDTSSLFIRRSNTSDEINNRILAPKEITNWKEDESPPKDSYSLLLDENFCLIDQLASKEYLCKKLENALGDISVQMDTMNRRRQKALDEKTRLASEERETEEIPGRKRINELDAQINRLEECGVVLQMEKQHLQATFQQESARQEKLANHLVGNMEQLKQAHTFQPSQISLEDETDALSLARSSDEHLNKLQDISKELLYQARLIQDSIAEKNKQVNHYHWEWVGNNLRLRSQLKDLRRQNKLGSKYRSWSSSECLNMPCGQEEDTPTVFVFPPVPKLDTSASEELGKKVEELKIELKKLSMIKRDSFMRDGSPKSTRDIDNESCSSSQRCLLADNLSQERSTMVSDQPVSRADTYTKRFITLRDAIAGSDRDSFNVIIPTTRKRFNQKGECLTPNSDNGSTCTKLSSSTSVIYATPSSIPTTSIKFSDIQVISDQPENVKTDNPLARHLSEIDVTSSGIEDFEASASPSLSRKDTAPKVKLLVEQYNEKMSQKSSQPTSEPCGTPIWSSPVTSKRHMGYSSVKTKAMQYQEKLEESHIPTMSILKASLSLPPITVYKSSSTGAMHPKEPEHPIQKSCSSSGIPRRDKKPHPLNTSISSPPISPPSRQSANHYMDLRRSSSSRARVMRLQKAREEFLSLGPGSPLGSPPSSPTVSQSNVTLRQKTLSVISSNSSEGTDPDDLTKRLSDTLDRYEPDKLVKASSYSAIHSDQPFYKRLSSLCSLFKGDFKRSSSPLPSGLESPSATARSPSPFSFFSRLRRHKNRSADDSGATVEELCRQSLYVNISGHGSHTEKRKTTNLTRVPSKSCPNSPNLGRRRARPQNNRNKWPFRRQNDKS